jgi:O-Antigen ligase
MPAAWLLAFVLLSAAPAAKIGDVQTLEILQTLCLAMAVPAFVFRGLKVPVSGPWRDYGGRYLALLCLCALLSLSSLRLPFYAPPGLSVLKRPLWISLSRIFELFLVAYFMLRTARTLRRRPALFRAALDAYVWAGTVSALLSIAAWVLVRTAGVETFAVYGVDQRVRGFFNEGGPYGIFLLSVAVVLLLRARLFPFLYPALRWPVLAVLASALVLSQSKAAFVAGLGLCGVAILFSASGLRKIALAGMCALVFAAALTFAGGKVLGYFYAYLNLDEAMAYRPGDPSLIMGRIAASVIVPRMIGAHPVLGIGLGNYSLMRNDPDYLQNLPPVSEWDLPGMGLFGSAAEFGVPLTLFLLALLLRPLVLSRRAAQPVAIAVAASFQPLAFLLGVNLNFFYPWLVAAFVMAAGGPISERNAST